MNKSIAAIASHRMSETTHNPIVTPYREARQLGDTMPQAVVLAIDWRGHTGHLLRDAGWALLPGGDHILRQSPTGLAVEFEAGYAAGHRKGSRDAFTIAQAAEEKR